MPERPAHPPAGAAPRGSGHWPRALGCPAPRLCSGALAARCSPGRPAARPSSCAVAARFFSGRPAARPSSCALAMRLRSDRSVACFFSDRRTGPSATGGQLTLRATSDHSCPAPAATGARATGPRGAR
ncbi:hypothetical protein Asi03nite_07650 [Actinoplanes siamensis]|uniref:Uncharacterized protein n=1 Tax=Actinoplanes siamensis TaxID=1223317 RepID=A0A919KDU4_9ACTN|nr:hypothetical protein Asi03nite_07650 [Actinoplanes siamensis]